MTAAEIARIIEEKFPPQTAEKWDNVGLLVGRRDKPVGCALLTLDVTSETVAEAKSTGADMIISHHPMMFSPVNRITDDSAEGAILLDLCRNDIAVFAAHTNLDSGIGGLNDMLAQIFSLADTEVVLKSDTPGVGLGRIGRLKEPMHAIEFARMAGVLLNTPVRFSGDENTPVHCVAVGSGASDDIFGEARRMGAELVLTGDCKYHRNLDAVAAGLCVVDAGHYPTEIIAQDIFAEILAECGIKLVKSKMTDVFKFV